MASEMFSFDIDCQPSAVSIKVFNEAVDAFTQMLAAADASNWQVSEARIASVHLTARPVVIDADAKKSVQALKRFSGLAGVGEHDKRSLRGFQAPLKKVSEVVQATGGTVTLSAGGESGTFTPEIVTSLNDEVEAMLARARRRSFGHIEGVVDKIVLQQNHRSLGVVDEITKKRVQVAFDSRLDEQVRKITPKSVVDIKGFILSPEGFPMSIKAEDIRLVPDRHRALVTAKDLEGIFSIQLPEGEDSVSLVRCMRDEDRRVGELGR